MDIAPIAKPLTWHQRIKQAKKAGFFSQEDKELAGQWENCPVGKKFHTSSRGPAYGSKLDVLGLEFLHRVRADQCRDAQELYKLIRGSTRADLRF